MQDQLLFQYMSICSSPFFFYQMETTSEKQDYLKDVKYYFGKCFHGVVSCRETPVFRTSLGIRKPHTAYFDSSFKLITNSMSNI